MKRTLKLINKWKLSLCDKSRHKKDFSNVILMHELLISKNYIFPPVSSDEIDAMIGLELQTLRTKESLEDEEKAILETKLEYYLWKGSANDIKKANEIMKQMIEIQVRLIYSINSVQLYLFIQDPMNYSNADSQIMQDLQKLTDKINLLEDLIENEDDNSSLQGLLQNPTINQMYKTCRRELPKLLELTNSDGLNEDLMNRIINATERLMKIKAKVEGNDDEDDVKNDYNQKNEISLCQSSDQLANAVFDDLPILSPNPTKKEPAQMIPVQQKSFLNNNDLVIDCIQLPDRIITRIMNISSKHLSNLKIDGKLVKNKLESFETFVTSKNNLKSIEYSENGRINLRENNISSESCIIDDISKSGIENLLLI